MHSHPAGLHDPKLVPEGARFEHGKEIPQAVEQRLKAGAGGHFQDYEAVGKLRRKPHDLPEIMVEGDRARPSAQQTLNTASSSAPCNPWSRTVTTSWLADRSSSIPRLPTFSSSLKFTQSVPPALE
jgi:hypothetical protein